jgi:hypothetical protein
MPTKYVWDSHTKMPNAKVEVRNQDELKITDDYDEWLETVWTKKVFAGLAQAREDMQTMFLWAAIHKDLRRFLTQQIVKSQADQAVTDNDFMRELFKRDGGKEWLDFNLKKFCSAATAVGAAHHKHVMFNATVTADGTNAKFVLSKMIMAVEQTCGQPPYNYPWMMGCECLVRAFQHCRVQNIDRAVRVRTINSKQLGAVDDTSTEATSYDFLDEVTPQGDSHNGIIDWYSRWCSLKRRAESLVAQLKVQVTQLEHVPESMFPTYAGGFTPICISGVTPGYHTGPLPNSIKQHAAHDRGRSRTPKPNTNNAVKAESPRQYKRAQSPFGGWPRKDDVYTSSPPTADQLRQWSDTKEPTCYACGSTMHTSWRRCHNRAQHFPDWKPDFERLNHVEATVAAVNAAEVLKHTETGIPAPPGKAPYMVVPDHTQTDKGSRYDHRDASGRKRGRSPGRHPDRGDSRERSPAPGEKHVTFSGTRTPSRSPSRGSSAERKHYKPASGNA